MRRGSGAVVLLLLFVLAACGSGSGGPKATSNYYAAGPTKTVTTHPPRKMNKHGVEDVSGKSSVKVEMDDYYFSPTIIRATPGQKLTLQLSNHGTVEHNFALASERIDRNVPRNKTASVQVTMPSSGLIAFFCKYHKTLGMAGELVARQPAFTG